MDDFLKDKAARYNKMSKDSANQYLPTRTFGDAAEILSGKPMPDKSFGYQTSKKGKRRTSRKY